MCPRKSAGKSFVRLMVTMLPMITFFMPPVGEERGMGPRAWRQGPGEQDQG